MNPEVSVIVPAFNQARFLEESVGSLVEQSFKNWECIIINDGSTDDTQTTARALAAKDPRIRTYSQSNRGLAAARNRGVSLTTAPFVQFLDADDLIDPDMIESQVSFLAAHPKADVCYSNYRFVRLPSGDTVPPFAAPLLGALPLEDFLFRWERGLSIPIHCALFRRMLWDGSNVFDEELPAKVDWPFWVRLAARGTTFHFLDRPWAVYRLHGTNMHTRRGAENALSFAQAASIIMEHVPEELRQRFVDATYDHVRNYERFQKSVSDFIEGGMPQSGDERSRESEPFWAAAFPNRILFEVYLRMDRRTRAVLADVSTPERRRNFIDWALAPDPESPGLSRLLGTLYRCRTDLRAAFPDVEGKDRQRFLDWARTTGPREMGYDPGLAASEGPDAPPQTGR